MDQLVFSDDLEDEVEDADLAVSSRVDRVTPAYVYPFCDITNPLLLSTSSGVQNILRRIYSIAGYDTRETLKNKGLRPRWRKKFPRIDLKDPAFIDLTIDLERRALEESNDGRCSSEVLDLFCELRFQIMMMLEFLHEAKSDVDDESKEGTPFSKFDKKYHEAREFEISLNAPFFTEWLGHAKDTQQRRHVFICMLEEDVLRDTAFFESWLWLCSDHDELKEVVAFVFDAKLMHQEFRIVCEALILDRERFSLEERQDWYLFFKEKRGRVHVNFYNNWLEVAENKEEFIAVCKLMIDDEVVTNGNTNRVIRESNVLRRSRALIRRAVSDHLAVASNGIGARLYHLLAA